MSNIIANVISLAIGAGVTWWVARRYYEKAGEEPRKETQELRKMTEIVLRALEAGGVHPLARDATGNITGLSHNLDIAERISPNDSIDSA